MKEIKITRRMVGTKELYDAIDHNSRCEMVAIIDNATKEALDKDDFVAVIRLCHLKKEAMKEDFQNYEGEHYLAEEDYENKVCMIMGDNV